MDVETYNETFRAIDEKYRHSLKAVIFISLALIILSLIIFHSFLLFIIFAINLLTSTLFLCLKYNAIMNNLDVLFREGN